MRSALRIGELNRVTLIALLVAIILPAQAAEQENLAQKIQDIKQQTLELNRDLFILEE